MVTMYARNNEGEEDRWQFAFFPFGELDPEDSVVEVSKQVNDYLNDIFDELLKDYSTPDEWRLNSPKESWKDKQRKIINKIKAPFWIKFAQFMCHFFGHITKFENEDFKKCSRCGKIYWIKGGHGPLGA
jgi:hypothetical protein